MPKRRHLAFTISVAILLGVRAVSASAKDLPCRYLRKAKAARLISIFGDNPLPNEMDFSHGLGCYSEGGEYPNPCDWNVAVSEDRNLSEDRRLIVVNTEHMTGQGAQGGVVVLGCLAGTVTALLRETFNREVAVEEASADKVVLKFSVWEPHDAVCCPSTEGRKVYVWSKDAQDYVLDREYSVPSAGLRARSAHRDHSPRPQESQ
jgi:hypothetical protein